MKVAIGVDIGGTKIASALVDECGNVRARREVSSAKQCAETLYDSVISIIQQVLMDEDMNASDLVGIGIGVPGKVDEVHGIVRHQNNLPFVDFPLASSVREHFKIENVVVANDVTMATIAESEADGEKEDTFVYITISTGIACSIMHEGKFMRGAGFSGEIGLLPVNNSSHPGEIIRLEHRASGPAIAKSGTELTRNPLSTKEVFEQYKLGNNACEKVVQQAFADIAQGLYAVICMLDPEKIVLGGGVMNNHPDGLDMLKGHLTPYLARGQEDVLDRIHKSFYQENSGIVGAAFHILKNEIY